MNAFCVFNNHRLSNTVSKLFFAMIRCVRGACYSEQYATFFSHDAL